MRAALLVVLTGCAPHVFWSGHTADRRHTVEIVERGGYHYAVFDGRRDRAYEAIAGASIVSHADHVAFAARRGKRWYVVADRRDSEPWDGIGAIVYGPNDHLAYVAERAGRWHVVVDTIAGPPFAAIHAGSLAFSDDGAHVAYAADDTTDHAHVVTDTTIGAAFDAVTPPAFADAVAPSTAAHARAVADTRAAQRVVYAGRHGTTWQLGDGPAWSAIALIAPHGDRVAYAASDGTAWHVVIDGDPGPSLDAVRRIAWDPTGAHVAWLAHADTHDVLAVDRAPILAAAHLRDDAFGFTPTGTFAFVEPTAAGERLVVGTEPQPTYAAIGARAWSADGKHLAYVATRPDRTVVVVADDRELPTAYTEVGPPLWSPTGALAYVARRDRRAVVVVANTTYPFDLAFEDSLAFSSSGAHWCVIAGDLAHEQLFFVVDGTRHIPLDAIEVYAAATAHADPTALRAWTHAEAERAETP